MFSGLYGKLDEAKSANVDFHQNWSYLCTWKEDVRYVSVNTKTAIDVERFLDALNHPSNGFLKWIKKYW